MKECKNCNKKYEQNDINYCPVCGSKLEEIIAQQCCIKCGAKLKNFMLFCPNCGERITKPQADPSNYKSSDTEINEEEVNENEDIQIITKQQLFFTGISIIIAWMSKKGTVIGNIRRGYGQIGEFNIFLAALTEGLTFLYIFALYNCIKRTWKNKKKGQALLYFIIGIIGLCILAGVRMSILQYLGVYPKY